MKPTKEQVENFRNQTDPRLPSLEEIHPTEDFIEYLRRVGGNACQVQDEIICDFDFTPIDFNSMTGYKEGELVDYSRYRVIDGQIHKSWAGLSLIITGLRNWNSEI